MDYSPQNQNQIPKNPQHSRFPKELIIGIIVILAVAGIVTAYYFQTKPTSYSTSETEAWQSYRDDKYAFEIKIPTGWIVEANDNELYFVSPRGQEGRKQYETEMKRGKHNNTDCCPPYYDFIFSVSSMYPNVEDFINNSENGFTNPNGVKFEQYDLIGSLYGGHYYATELPGQLYNFEIINGSEEILRQILSTFKFREWQTYRNEEFGFEFQYPESYVEHKFKTNDPNEIFGQGFENAEDNSIYISISNREFDPSTIHGLYGDKPVEDSDRITLGGISGYKYSEGDAGCGGDIYEIPLMGKTFSVTFGFCEGADEYGNENELTPDYIITQILSTFKFIK